ncbi:MAG TPA: FHA domain-containing protein [Actinomycetota bacterium]
MAPTVESDSHPATDAVLRVGSDPSFQGWRLTDHSYTIGRDEASSIRLGDPRVSRQHARLYRQAGQWWISDLGSANGTWVNGQQVEQSALSPGDRIQVGGTDLILTVPQARAAEGVVPRNDPTAAVNRGGPGTTFHIRDQAGDIDNIGRDQNIYVGSDAASLEELRKAGPALKALFAVAILLCVAGLVVFIGGMFFMDTTLPDPRNPGFIDDVLEGPETPLNVIVGFGLFLTGFVLAVIASLILALKRRKE